MINITRGNDFKLIATFTRGGEDYKFDSVGKVTFLGPLNRKYPQTFEYADGKLTIKGSHELAAGVYGIEVVGKEGDQVRRTAYNNAVTISNMTTAGSYEPVDDIDDYDIGMTLVLDMTVDKTSGTSSETKSDDTDSKSDSSETKSDGGSSADSGTTASGSDTGSSASGSDTGSTGTEGDKSSTEGQG